MTARKRHFIVIDDNKLDCFIAEKIILNTGVSEKISVFDDARKALEYIREEIDFTPGSKLVILVDIQMPMMNGFEFVEAFESLPEETRNKFVVFMLTSSINQSDLNRISNYTSVLQLLNKPLSVVKLTSMMAVLS
ncbi:MAG: response regulator [Chitinophagaceae bacterium]